MLGWEILDFSPISNACLYIFSSISLYPIAIYLDIVGGIYTEATMTLSPLFGLCKPASIFFGL